MILVTNTLGINNNMNKISTQLSLLIFVFILNSLCAYSQNESLNDFSEPTITNDSINIDKLSVEYGVGIGIDYNHFISLDFEKRYKESLLGISLKHNIQYTYVISLIYKYPFILTKNIYLAPTFIINFGYYDGYYKKNFRFLTFSELGFNLNIYGIYATIGLNLISDKYKVILNKNNSYNIKLGYILYF